MKQINTFLPSSVLWRTKLGDRIGKIFFILIMNYEVEKQEQEIK